MHATFTLACSCACSERFTRDYMYGGAKPDVQPGERLQPPMLGDLKPKVRLGTQAECLFFFLIPHPPVTVHS